MGMVIHRDWCKWLEFGYSNKFYMPKVESDPENDLWDFEPQTDHLIPARRPGLVFIKKKLM